MSSTRSATRTTSSSSTTSRTTTTMESLSTFYSSERLKQARVDQWHHNMLNDANRNHVYNAAINKCLANVSEDNNSSKDNKTLKEDNDLFILDIGAGTGILTFMALSASPRVKVVACEVNPHLCSLMNHLLLVNEALMSPNEALRSPNEALFCSRLNIINRLSTLLRVEDDLKGSKVDLVITETFDAGLLGEHVLESLDHAHKHLMKNDEIDNKKKLNQSVLPAQARLFCAGLRNECLSKSYFSHDLINVDLINEPYDCLNLNTLYNPEFVTDSKLVCQIDFCDGKRVEQLLREKNYFDVELELLEKKCEEDLKDKVSAIVVWFELDFLGDNSIVLSTNPQNKDKRTCWDQVIFPVMPKTIGFGKKLSLKFEICGALRILSIQDKIIDFKAFSNRSFPSDFIAYCNDEELMTFQEREAVHLIYTSQKSNFTVIEMTSTAILGLSMLQKSPSPSISLKLFNNDKSRLLQTAFFVHRRCLRNRICMDKLASFDAINDLVKDINNEDKNNVVVVYDPVLRNGHMDEEAIENAAFLRKKFPNFIIFPGKVTICCELVSSPDLLRRSRITPSNLQLKSQNLAEKLAEAMDKLGSLHILDLQLNKEIVYTPLTSIVKFENLDLLNNVFYSETQSVMATTKGRAEAIIYWYELNYGHNSISTFKSDGDLESNRKVKDNFGHCYYRQAAFIVENCFEIDVGRQIDITCNLFHGKLRLVASTEAV